MIDQMIQMGLGITQVVVAVVLLVVAVGAEMTLMGAI